MEILHMGTPGCSFEEQERRLHDSTQLFAGRMGGHITAQTDAGNIVEVNRRTNHPLHAVLTLFTFFMWLPVWLSLWAINSHAPVKYLVQVTGQGQVFVEKVK